MPSLHGSLESPQGSQRTSDLKGEMGPFRAALSHLLPYSLAQIIEVIQCRMCHIQFPRQKCSRGRGLCTAVNEACTTGRIYKSKLWVGGRRTGWWKQTGMCRPQEKGGTLLQINPRVPSVSHSVVQDSLGLHRLQPASLFYLWTSPGKNTGVGCHFLLHGIFPTQGLNQKSPVLQADCLLSEPPGKP